MMSGRKRLLTVLAGGIPDRVPVVAWFDHAYLRQILSNDDFDFQVESIRLAKELGFDVMLRMVLPQAQDWETDSWCLRTTSLQQDEITRTTKTIETPGGELREVVVQSEFQPGFHFTHTEEHLVKSRADLELLQRFEIVRPPVDTRPLRRAQTLVADDGIVVPYGGGAAHTGAALYLRGLAQLTIDAIEEPALYSGLLEWAIEYERDLLPALAKEQPDLCQIGGLMAQGNMLGPKFYRKQVLPYDRAYIRRMHAHDLRTVYHNCGSSNNLLELYAELGSDAYETFAPPPLADNDLRRVKQVLGSQAVILGNIDQVHMLRKGERNEIEKTVKDTVLSGKPGGRYILMTADEIHHQVPLENLKIMAQTAIQYGQYSNQRMH
jgi:hypothetical protein